MPWAIKKAPHGIVDDVLILERCHLIHPSHSGRSGSWWPASTKPSPPTANGRRNGGHLHPAVLLLETGPQHWEIMSKVLGQAGTAGNLTMDAHLAALAVEHGGTVHSCDADFRRLPGLRLVNPLA